MAPRSEAASAPGKIAVVRANVRVLFGADLDCFVRDFRIGRIDNFKPKQ
jgi:hypothetical protein